MNAIPECPRSGAGTIRLSLPTINYPPINRAASSKADLILDLTNQAAPASQIKPNEMVHP